MEEDIKEQGNISKIMDRLDAMVNLFCVVFLTLQVVSIIIMIIGRYFFNYVPRGTEEFALFCMVWFSLLSISLSIRDDAHIKMELMDVLVAADKIKYFQYLSALVNIIFSVFMISYGVELVKLTSSNILSTFRISEGFLYLAIPVSGVFMMIASIVLIIENVRRSRNVN
ncbi:TRAP transporter small permease [Cellulosilyticum sp. I15G10I2]|uniref:TRAP transporter small permease n=1 Tax=Cellulosilyticum sp. I15G10I2 TaxID=1892843 RepID=UPI00085C30E7|nr:TRAP transporter small permease [Cellulosilyticum sp. I15G10I2]